MTNKREEYIIDNAFGDMAQLVERLVRNEEASGSNPLISTRKGTAISRPFFVVEISNAQPLNYQRFVRTSKNDCVTFFRKACCERSPRHRRVYAYFYVLKIYKTRRKGVF